VVMDENIGGHQNIGVIVGWVVRRWIEEMIIEQPVWAIHDLCKKMYEA
jgi:hypothetical protein